MRVTSKQQALAYFLLYFEIVGTFSTLALKLPAVSTFLLFSFLLKKEILDTSLIINTVLCVYMHFL